MIGERRCTERLELVAVTADLARLTAETPDRLGEALQAAIPPDWPPEHLDAGFLDWQLSRLTSDPTQAGWLSWYLIGTGDGPRTLVGFAGFQGPPDAEGTVTIGYSIVASFQRRGLAPEACLELFDWALADPAVREIVAETLSHLTPSIRVMEKLGMTFAGEGTEPGVVRYSFLRIGCASKYIPRP